MAFNMSLYDHLAFVNDNNIFKSCFIYVQIQYIINCVNNLTINQL